MQAAAQATLDFLKLYWAPLLCGVMIVAVLPIIVGYIVLVERKVMADMQARLGPMRVGPHGLLQPIADAVKLLIKEDIIPDDADKLVFWLAPVFSVGAALLAIAGLAFGPAFQIAQDLDIGLLFVVGISALGIFGIVLGGWASNSHYSLMGALRSSAQLVSYETAAGMALVCGLLFAGTLNIKSIVAAQWNQGVWFGFLAPVAFFTYLVASIAETNRAPFDLPEAESELVAGYMTEFSGFRWSLYFLAEYVNMIVVASVATTLFLGGWLRPFAKVGWLNFLDYLPPLMMLGIAGYCLIRMPKQPKRAADVHAGCGRALFRCDAGAGRAGTLAVCETVAQGCCGSFLCGNSRWLLVHFQSERVHLLLHVAAFYDTALSLRSTDAAGMAFLDPALHHQRAGGRCGLDCRQLLQFAGLGVASGHDAGGDRRADRGSCDFVH